MECFPENQIKIILFDDFMKDSLKTINSVCNFLEIKELKTLDETKHNAALMPKNKFLNRFLVNSGLKKFALKLLNDNNKEKLKLLFFQNTKIPEISSEDRLYLKELYKEEILKTSKLINRDLTHWIK